MWVQFEGGPLSGEVRNVPIGLVRFQVPVKPEPVPFQGEAHPWYRTRGGANASDPRPYRTVTYVRQSRRRPVYVLDEATPKDDDHG